MVIRCKDAEDADVDAQMNIDFEAGGEQGGCILKAVAMQLVSKNYANMLRCTHS